MPVYIRSEWPELGPGATQCPLALLSRGGRRASGSRWAPGRCDHSAGECPLLLVRTVTRSALQGPSGRGGPPGQAAGHWRAGASAPKSWAGARASPAAQGLRLPRWAAAPGGGPVPPSPGSDDAAWQWNCDIASRHLQAGPSATMVGSYQRAITRAVHSESAGAAGPGPSRRGAGHWHAAAVADGPQCAAAAGARALAAPSPTRPLSLDSVLT